MSFYEGNDLLVRSIPPPPPQAIDDSGPQISLHSLTANKDVWVQLKSTDVTWTLAGFLPKQNPARHKPDNLLRNFICNAFASQQQGHSWQARLKTQGSVKTEGFLANPKEPHLTRLNQIVESAKAHIDSSTLGTTVDEQILRDLALEVLKQLAAAKPKSFESLKSEIEVEIAYSCFNREVAQQIANSLRGALLKDAAAGPAVSRSYDLDWLNEKAGRPIKSVALFDVNPLAACNEAVKQVLPARWTDDHFVRREQFENALEGFLNARETLFVLVGTTGRGKSWVAADLASRILKERVRLLIPGHALHYNPNLASIVAKYIRPWTSSVDWSDEQLFKRTLAAAGVKGRGPFLIVIDDLVPPALNVELFIHSLVSLVSDCRENRVKLVITCQQQIWDLYQLADSMPANELFLLERGFSSNQLPQLPRPTYSFLLGDLTPDELTEVVTRRLPEQGEEGAALLLRASPFLVLRNAYLLEQYLDQHGDSLGKASRKPAPVDVNELLDMRVSKALKKVAQSLSLSEQDLQPAFDSIIKALWPQRLEGLPYARVSEILKPMIGEQTGNFLVELRKAGLLTTTGALNIAEDRIADRIYARHFAEFFDGDSNEELLVTKLRPETDTGLVAALMRGIVSNPVVLAERLLRLDKRWMKGISEGLAQTSTSDYRVVATLAGLLRSDPQHWILAEVGDAFGQLASRDARAWKGTETRGNTGVRWSSRLEAT